MRAVIVLGLLAAASPVSAVRTASARDGMRVAEREVAGQGTRAPHTGPTIEAVLAAAYAAAGLERDRSGGWSKRARLAGLVPWLTVRTTRDDSWQDTASEVGHSTTLELRATWRLDRLVFDNHELQISNIETARRRQRRQLASRVIRAYFAWRRAERATAGRERPETGARDRRSRGVRDHGEAADGDDSGELEAAEAGALDARDDATDRALTRTAEAMAELDALTEGWFSDELSRMRWTAAGPGRSAPPREAPRAPRGVGAP